MKQSLVPPPPPPAFSPLLDDAAVGEGGALNGQRSAARTEGSERGGLLLVCTPRGWVEQYFLPHWLFVLFSLK